MNNLDHDDAAVCAYTDEELAEKREYLSFPQPRQWREARWLATLDTRDAAHRQEIAEMERAATDSERATAELVVSLRQEIAERDARVASLLAQAVASEQRGAA